MVTSMVTSQRRHSPVQTALLLATSRDSEVDGWRRQLEASACDANADVDDDCWRHLDEYYMEMTWMITLITSMVLSVVRSSVSDVLWRRLLTISGGDV